MDIQLRGVNFTTNVRGFDKVISLFANEKIREFPRINNPAMKFFKNISKSEPPIYTYLRAEKPLISRIEEILNKIS